MIDFDAALKQELQALDLLQANTIERLERVEGPNCDRYHPTFNIYGHPYWSEVNFGSTTGSLFGDLFGLTGA